MKDGSVILVVVAALLGLIALRKGAAVAGEGLLHAARQFIVVMPRLLLATLTAGFVGVLTPSEPIAELIGADSGIRGILIASVVGGFVPSGPIISFPIVVVLSHAGAGVPQLVAFVTAWSVFAFHRVLIYESTMMGWRFSAIRLASSAVLPPVAGLAALGMSAAL